MFSLKQTIRRLTARHANEHSPDKKLIIAVGIIVVFGLAMLSSATTVYAYSKFHSSYYFLKRQIVWLCLSIISFWFFSRVDYRRWGKYAFWFLVFSILLLILVFIPGLKASYGSARSWIDIGFTQLQPSEFVKVSFLLYLAAWLENRKSRLKDISEGIGPFLLVLGIIAFLMLMQPDFGTLFIIILTSLVIYFVGGGSKKYVVAVVLVGAIALFLMLKIKPYQVDRFRCFLDPSFSASDKCYQINQSLIAIGSGGLWGRGFGASRQKFLYLPEVYSDSIFAIIGEEMGFIFSSSLVILYLFIFYRGYLTAKYAPDGYGRILAIGIITWLVSQAMINIGGMINSIPMTGVPLPFISYGGSSLLAALSAVGILVNISKQTRVS